MSLYVIFARIYAIYLLLDDVNKFYKKLVDFKLRIYTEKKKNDCHETTILHWQRMF